MGPSSFPPLCGEDARILILGTYPSPLSFESGFYYGHPRNRFWPLLAELLEETTPVTTEEKKTLLIRNKIGLWDVLDSCDIVGASDASIRNPVYHDVHGLLAERNIKAVFFNGAQAEKLFLKQKRELPIPSFRLPSTSPANAAFSMEKLYQEWGIILDALKND
ncbi:MAG: DNA-deoxyinosine glycosylase [Oscillospiraceae bacterium]|nr:DNA-deoxyinosine glycosylase [Oscillospiraceae bacterium]